MDEETYWDDEQDSSDQEEEASATEQSAVDAKALEKLRKENHSLRTRLRKAELTEKYGGEVAGLIPDSLPIKEWGGFAEKLKASLDARVAESPTDKAGEKAPEEEPTPDEKRLAAVAKGSQESGSASRTITWDEYQARLRDPDTHLEAMRMRKAGLVDESTYH